MALGLGVDSQPRTGRLYILSLSCIDLDKLDIFLYLLPPSTAQHAASKMAAPMDPREAEKAAGVANQVEIPIKPEQENDECIETKKKKEKKEVKEKKKTSNGFLVSLAGESG